MVGSLLEEILDSITRRGSLTAAPALPEDQSRASVVWREARDRAARARVRRHPPNNTSLLPSAERTMTHDTDLSKDLIESNQIKEEKETE
jgi:hypothetical protein